MAFGSRGDLAVLEFFSGVASPAIWQGFADAAAPMCLVVGALSEAGLERALRYARAGGHLLLDSGAFIYREEPDRVDWDAVLSRYARIAVAGPNVEVILPDVVGCQAGTLALARRWSTAIRRLRSTRARLLIPMQAGDLPFGDYLHRYQNASGITADGLALPSNAAALSEAQLAEVLQMQDAPRRIHFLGISRTAVRFAPRLRQVLEAWPDAEISCDACVHRAYVGGRREITLDRARRLRALEDAALSGYDETEDDEGADQARAALTAMFPRAGEEELAELICSDWGRSIQLSIFQEQATREAGPQATRASIGRFARRRLAGIPAVARRLPEMW